ncbi:MAG: hypothetical protein JSS56_15950 [Proteobacteria bacterium]|nr:hypothetical protein [Pseudomonadota bacterium]
MQPIFDIPEIPLNMQRQDGSPITRAHIVAEARSWIGTRFVDQHAEKGVATDCYGFVRGVLSAIGVLPDGYESQLPEAALVYHRPNGAMMKRVCDERLTPVQVNRLQPGDFLLLRVARQPQHFAIVGDSVYPGHLSLIHALGPSAPASVVEMRFDRPWTERVVGAYAIPGLEDWAA